MRIYSRFWNLFHVDTTDSKQKAKRFAPLCFFLHQLEKYLPDYPYFVWCLSDGVNSHWPTNLNSQPSTFLRNSCLQTDLILDYAVPIYQNPQPINITFTVSIYPSETLGQLLMKLRLEKGLEQRELARKLRVNRNSVCEWKKDSKRPSRKSMERLVRFFEISREVWEDFENRSKKGFLRW